MGVREARRESTTTAILDVARQHLVVEGAEHLSLRAVARDLDLSVSALYRYYRDREALLAALVEEGFNDCAEAVEARKAAVARTPLSSVHRRRFRASAVAYRDWARANPSRFLLVFGGPLSAALVGPGEAETAAAWSAATGGEALVASLLPFARPWPDPLPTPARDLAEAVRPHDDHPDTVEPDDALALFQTDTGPISRRRAVEAAAAHAADRRWGSSCRVISDGPLDESALIEGLLAPWTVGGSVVWVGNPIATSVVSVVEQERVTDRA
jgi:AcrR family transcriptional regulator